MRPRERRRHHPLANRFEDFRFAEIGNQQSERERVGHFRRGDIRAGSGAAVDIPGELQIPDGARDRDSRRAELPLKVGFARQAVAGFQPSRLQVAQQRVEHALIFGHGRARGHG